MYNMRECKDDKLPDEDSTPGTPDPEQVNRDEIQDVEDPEVPQPEPQQFQVIEVRGYGGQSQAREVKNFVPLIAH